MEGEKRGAKKKKRVKKGGKKGRKRKEKDLTPDRTTESLFEELVLNGEDFSCLFFHARKWITLTCSFLALGKRRMRRHFRDLS